MERKIFTHSLINPRTGRIHSNHESLDSAQRMAAYGFMEEGGILNLITHNPPKEVVFTPYVEEDYADSI